MHVVVTGAGGFIGRRLGARLSELRIAWARIDSASWRDHPEAQRRPLSLIGSDAKSFCTHDDLRLVHLSWDVGHRRDRDRQSQCVTDTQQLLDAITVFHPTQVIALGSAEEYGRRGGFLDERDRPIPPLSVYGQAKEAVREVARLWSTRNAPVLWLRPFLIYGPGQTGDMMVPTAVAAAERKTAERFTDGRQERDFVHVDDVVDAIVKGLHSDRSGFEIVNVGTGVPVAVRDFLAELAAVFDAEGCFRLGAIERRPEEPDTLITNPDKALRLLGWRARIDWRTGVKSLRQQRSPAA